ncbi:MAG TPA: translation initiation factor IF-2 associated domain-containing protein, partial [Propylenella sp.]|nr:translation initiation factor IF-2 associated domain-containing protein [Propylenella sp.]
MSDTTSNDKTIRVGRKPLSMPKRDTDTVRQSFSGGRSKPVLVEKKRRVSVPGKRTELPGSTEREETARPLEAAVQAPAARAEASASPQARPRASGVVLRTLTDEERDARAHALAEARVREAEER